jgi:acylphosphatase
MIVAVRLEIFGNVQGVGFRAFVTRCARTQALRGWVRNRRDGNVEALLIGEEDPVALVIEQCRRGPPLAHIARLETLPAQDDGTAGFTERPTV